ncbi:MAG: DUF58 domain-containing protein, partial [Acidobacteria bacterium]|nr:DUF58 domain-containing protein [Acidobacteriota bacterium]
MSRKLPLALLFLSVLLLALLTGFRPFYLLLYMGSGMLALGYAWAWLQTRRLDVRVQMLSSRPEVGKPFYFKAAIYEKIGIPRLELYGRASIGQVHTEEEQLSLRPKGASGWTGTAWWQTRGLHSFGSLTIVGHDPLGLVRVERQLGDSRPVVVYPATVQISAPSFPGQAVGNGGAGGVGGIGPSRAYTTPATVREYLPGDRVSNIHWVSTARTGQLMAKQFQEVESVDLWLLLDMQEEAQTGEGPTGTEEYIVSIAA